MGPYQSYIDPDVGRSSTYLHKLHGRSERYELLGKAGPSQTDVLTAKEGKVHHFNDVEKPSQFPSQ